MLDNFFSNQEKLRFESFKIADETIMLKVSTKQKQAICPNCKVVSKRPHRSYKRKPSDVSWSGVVVKINLQLYRYFCDNEVCERRRFVERITQFIAPYAHRTNRLVAFHREIGFSLGGEGGSRLASRLKTPISADTILRLFRTSDSNVNKYLIYWPNRKDSGLKITISLFISVLILMGITACSPVAITPANPVPTTIESTNTPIPTDTATLTATPTTTLTPTATYTPTPVYEMKEIKHETNVLKDVSFASEIVTTLPANSEVILLDENAYLSPADPAWRWWNVRTVEGDGYIAEITDEGLAQLDGSCALTMYDAMKLAINKYSMYPGFGVEYSKWDNTSDFEYNAISLGLTKTEIINGVPVDAVKILAVDLSPQTGKPTARTYLLARYGI